MASERKVMQVRPARPTIEGARFLLVAGKPIREPVAWGGPVVMNTKEELRRAFEEYENGTFIRHAGKK